MVFAGPQRPLQAPLGLPLRVGVLRDCHEAPTTGITKISTLVEPVRGTMMASLAWNGWLEMPSKGKMIF
jgi:hypothetical protein